MGQVLTQSEPGQPGLTHALISGARHALAIIRIARSRLFDADWYRAQSGPAVPGWMTPLWHYVCYGRSLDPSPHFDSAWYVAQRPQAAPDKQVPFYDYLKFGGRCDPNRSRDPNRGFSNWWYLRRYPDVRRSGMAPLEHYVRVGRAQGRDPRPLPGTPQFRGGQASATKAAVRSDTESKAPMPGRQRLCIFSHYHPRGRILPWLQRYLAQIQKSGFEVRLVTTAQAPDAEDCATLQANGIHVYRRDNKGYDFGSWQWAMQNAVSVHEVDWLLLANDSVFGPLYDLAPIMKAQLESDVDFWSITDSYQLAWHLQSHFICFRGEVVRSDAFRDCFSQDFPSKSKWSVINDGEILLSQSLAKAGFRGKAVYPFDLIDAEHPAGICNPSQFHWKLLIEKFRCPFIKRDLILRNPERVAGVSNWPDVIAEYTDMDVGLIREGLKSFRRWPQLPIMRR